MPGVPTALKCDSCRHRKKKCDMLQPSCSRCIHLGIQCIGSGQQRYRFVGDTTLVRKVKEPEVTISVIEEKSMVVPSQILCKVSGLQLAVASALQSDDVAYDLTMWGKFLKEVPGRLGHNQALDASAKAVVSCFDGFRAGCTSLNAIEEYSDGLAVLRKSLDDPNEAASINTICAIYMMIICQTLMGQALVTTHGEGLHYLLKTAAMRADFRKDPFTNELLTILCMPVLIESIANPNINLSGWLETLCSQRDAALPIHSIKFLQLAKVRDYIRDPYGNETDIRNSYQRVGQDIQLMQRVCSSMPLYTPKVQAQTQGLYCFILAYGMLLNTIILRAFEPTSILLAQESAIMLNDVLALAKDSLQFRPIGSSASATMLMAVWPCASARQGEVEELLDEMTTDFPIANWRESAKWLDDSITYYSRPEMVYVEPPPARNDKSAACTVM